MENSREAVTWPAKTAGAAEQRATGSPTGAPPLFGDLVGDFRVGLRSLARRRAFTLAFAASLGLGLGLSGFLASLIERVFFQSLPVVEPDRLTALYTTSTDDSRFLPVSYPNFESLRERLTGFSTLTAFQGVQLNLGDGTHESVWGQMVTGNFFQILGVRPLLGKFFPPDDDRRSPRLSAIVLSHALWTRRFGQDPGILGSPLLVNGRQFTVIGIGPKDFFGTGRFFPFYAWVPFSTYREIFPWADKVEDRRWSLFRVFGRLKPNVGFRQAEREVRTVASRLAADYPVENKGLGLRLFNMKESLLGVNHIQLYRNASTLLGGAAALLLLTACANVANLLLGQTLSRYPTVQLRLLLGASRWRILRQSLAEAVWLALFSLALALVASHWGGRLLWRLRPPYVPADAVDIGVRLSDGAGIAVVALVACLTLALLLHRRSGNPYSAASAGSRGQRAGAARQLVVGLQIAVAFVTLAGAGLFFTSLLRLSSVDPGFATQGLLMMTVDLKDRNDSAQGSRAFCEEAAHRMAALPGVRSVAVAESPLLEGVGIVLAVVKEGEELVSGQTRRLTRVNGVTAGYFAATGIKLVRGRTFQGEDLQPENRVAIINQTLARTLWPGEDPLGRRFRFLEEPRPLTVVGVARDAKYSTLIEPPTPFIYLPFGKSTAAAATLILRVPPGHKGTLEAGRSILQQLGVRVTPTVATVEELLRKTRWAPRTGTGVLMAFGAVALLLACLGVYSVASLSVHERYHEIGVRIALGATRAGLLKVVSLDGLILVSCGVAAGALVSVASARWLRGVLFGIDRLSWAAILIPGGVLLTASLVAQLLPLARALRINPMTTIRDSR